MKILLKFLICDPTSGDHNFFNMNPIDLIPSAMDSRASIDETESPGGGLEIAKRAKTDSDRCACQIVLVRGFLSVPGFRLSSP